MTKKYELLVNFWVGSFLKVHLTMKQSIVMANTLKRLAIFTWSFVNMQKKDKTNDQNKEI